MSGRLRRALVLAVLVAALCAYAVTRVRIGADFSAFLPAGADASQRALVQQLREGAAGRLVLIELSGAPPAALAQASRALRDALAQAPAFRYVANGDAVHAREDLALVHDRRYALSPRVDAAAFSVEGLRAALAGRLEGLYGSAAPFEKAMLADDPTGETRAMLGRLVPAQAPRVQDGVWFDATGTRALLVAATAAPASDLAGQSGAVAALRKAHASNADGSTLAFSSPGTMAVASRDAIGREAGLLSAVSATLIVAVLAWTYRAARPVALCALPAGVGLLAGVCAVHALLGHLNGITLAFGATLLGEAVDYPSFLFTQIGPGETPAAARRRVLPLLRLTVLTTACGSLALLLSGFPGLVELGVLTLTGILAAGAVTAWVAADWVPAGLGHSLPRLPRIGRRRVPLHRPMRWTLVVALTFAALAGLAGRPVWDDDPAHLSPLPAALAAHDRELRAALNAPDVRTVVLVRGSTVEDVLERSERLRGALVQAQRAGALGGYDLASDFLPSLSTQARRRAALPDPDLLRANLAQAVAGTPFRAEAFAPFLRDVEAARTAPPLTEASLGASALGARVGALLGADADGRYAVVPLRAVTDPAAVEAAVAALHDRSITWLDLRTASTAMLSTYRHKVLVATGAGTALIAAVLSIGLRDARRGIVVLAPVLFATVLAAAALVAAGTQLTVFHLVALLLVVGIGVNYALFAERAARHAEEGARTVRTLLVVSATTLCAFATLAFSTLPVLRALGVTVCAGVLACLAVVGFVHAPNPDRRLAREDP